MTDEEKSDLVELTHLTKIEIQWFKTIFGNKRPRKSKKKGIVPKQIGV